MNFKEEGMSMQEKALRVVKEDSEKNDDSVWWPLYNNYELFVDVNQMKVVGGYNYKRLYTVSFVLKEFWWSNPLTYLNR